MTAPQVPAVPSAFIAATTRDDGDWKDAPEGEGGDGNDLHGERQQHQPHAGRRPSPTATQAYSTSTDQEVAVETESGETSRALFVTAAEPATGTEALDEAAPWEGMNPSTLTSTGAPEASAHWKREDSQGRDLLLKDLVDLEELAFILREPPIKGFVRHHPGHAGGGANGDAAGGSPLMRDPTRHGTPILPLSLFANSAALLNPSQQRHRTRKQGAPLYPAYTTPPPSAAMATEPEQHATAHLLLALDSNGVDVPVPASMTTPEDLCSAMDFSDYLLPTSPPPRDRKDSRRGSSNHQSPSERDDAAASRVDDGGPLYTSPAEQVPAPDVLNLTMCDLEAVRRSIMVHTRRWRPADILARFKRLVARSIREEERQNELLRSQEKEEVAPRTPTSTVNLSGRPPPSPSAAARTGLERVRGGGGGGGCGESAAEERIRSSSFLNGPDTIPSGGLPARHLHRARAQLIWEYEEGVRQELQRLQHIRCKDAEAARSTARAATHQPQQLGKERNAAAATHFPRGNPGSGSRQAARVDGRAAAEEEPPRAPPTYACAWDVDLSDDLAVTLAAAKQWEADKRRQGQQQQQRFSLRTDPAAAANTASNSGAGVSAPGLDGGVEELADALPVPLPTFVYVVSRLLFQLHYAHLFPPGLFAHGLLSERDAHDAPEEVQHSPEYYVRLFPRWLRRVRQQRQLLCPLGQGTSSSGSGGSGGKFLVGKAAEEVAGRGGAWGEGPWEGSVGEAFARALPFLMGDGSARTSARTGEVEAGLHPHPRPPRGGPPPPGRCYRAYLRHVAQLPVVCAEVAQMMSRCRAAAYEFFSQMDVMQRGEVRWSEFSDALIERAEVVHHRTLAEDAAAERSAALAADTGKGGGGARGAADGVEASSVFDRYLVGALPLPLQRSGYTSYVVEVRHSRSLVLLEGPFDVAVCDGTQMGSVAFKIAVRAYEDVVADVVAAEERDGGGGGDGVSGIDLAEDAALARRPWRQNQKVPSVYITYEDGKRLHEVAAMEVIQQLSGKRRRRHHRMARRRQERGEGHQDKGTMCQTDTDNSDDDDAKEAVSSENAQKVADQRNRRVFLQDALLLSLPFFAGMAPVLLTLHTDLSLRLYRTTRHTLQAAPEAALVRFRETVTAFEWAGGGCAMSDSHPDLPPPPPQPSSSMWQQTQPNGGSREDESAEGADAYSSLLRTRVLLRQYLLLGTRSGQLRLLHLHPLIARVSALHGADASDQAKHAAAAAAARDTGSSTLIEDAAKYMVSQDHDAQEGCFHSSVVTSIRTATRHGDGAEDGGGAHGSRGGWNVLSASLDGTVCLSKLVAPLPAGPLAHTSTTSSSAVAVEVAGAAMASKRKREHEPHPELRPVARIKVCDAGLRQALSVPHAHAILVQTVSHQVYMYSENNHSMRVEFFDAAAPHFAPLVAMVAVDGLDQLITADCSGFVKVWSISRAMPLISFYALSREAQGSLQGLLEADDDGGHHHHPPAWADDSDDDAADSGGAGRRLRRGGEANTCGDPAAQEQQRRRKSMAARRGLDMLNGSPGVVPPGPQGSNGGRIAAHRPFYLKPLSSLAYDHTTKLFFALGLRNAVICTFASGQGGVKAHGERVRFLGIGRVRHLAHLQGGDELANNHTGLDKGSRAADALSATSPKGLASSQRREGKEEDCRVVAATAAVAVGEGGHRQPSSPPHHHQQQQQREWMLLSMSSADGRLWATDSGTMLMGIRAADPAYSILAADRLSCLGRGHRPNGGGPSVALGVLRAAGEGAIVGGGGAGGLLDEHKRPPHTTSDVLHSVEAGAERRRRERVRERYEHHAGDMHLPPDSRGGAAPHGKDGAHQPASLLEKAAAAAAGTHWGGGSGYYGDGGGPASNLSDTARNANAKGGSGDVLCACWGQHESSFLYALSSGDIRMHRTDSGRLIKTFLATPPTLEDVLDAAIRHRKLYMAKREDRRTVCGSHCQPPSRARSLATAAAAGGPPSAAFQTPPAPLAADTHAGDRTAGGSPAKAREGEGEEDVDGEVFAVSPGGRAKGDGRARNEAVMARARIKAGILRAQLGGGGGGVAHAFSSSSGENSSAAAAARRRWATSSNIERIEAVAMLLQRLLLDRPSSSGQPGSASASPSSLPARKASFHLEAISMHCLESSQELLVVYADGVVRYFALVGHSLAAHRLVVPEYLVAKCVYYLNGPAPSNPVAALLLPPSPSPPSRASTARRNEEEDDGRESRWGLSPPPALASSSPSRPGPTQDTRTVGDAEEGGPREVWAALRPASASPDPAPCAPRGTSFVASAPPRTPTASPPPPPPPSATTTAAATAPISTVEVDAVSLVVVSTHLQLVCVVLISGMAVVLDVGHSHGGGSGDGDGPSFASSADFGGGSVLHSFTTAEEVTAATFLGAYPCLVLADRRRCLHFYLLRGASLLALHEDFFDDLLRDRVAAAALPRHSAERKEEGEGEGEDDGQRAVRSTHVFSYTMSSASSAAPSPSSDATAVGGQEEENEGGVQWRARADTHSSDGSSVIAGGQPTTMHFDPLYCVLYVGTRDGYLRSLLLRKLIVALDLQPLSVTAARVSLDAYHSALKAQQQQRGNGEAVRNTLFLLFGVAAEDVARHVQQTHQETGGGRQYLDERQATGAAFSLLPRASPPPPIPSLNSLLWVYRNCRALLLPPRQQQQHQTEQDPEQRRRNRWSSRSRSHSHSRPRTSERRASLAHSNVTMDPSASAARRLEMEETQTFFLTSTRLAKVDGVADSGNNNNNSSSREAQVTGSGVAGLQERGQVGGADNASFPRRRRCDEAVDDMSPRRSAQGRLPLSLHTATLSDLLLATAVMQCAMRILRWRHAQEEEAEEEEEERGQGGGAAKKGSQPGEGSGSPAVDSSGSDGLLLSLRDRTSGQPDAGSVAAATATPLRQQRRLSLANDGSDGVGGAFPIGPADVALVRRWVRAALRAQRGSGGEGRSGRRGGGASGAEGRGRQSTAAAAAAEEEGGRGTPRVDTALAFTSKELVRSVEDEVLGKTMRRLRAHALGAFLTATSVTHEEEEGEGNDLDDSGGGGSLLDPRRHPITSQWVEPLFTRHVTFMSANTPLALLSPAATLERARREQMERERQLMRTQQQQRLAEEGKGVPGTSATMAATVPAPSHVAERGKLSTPRSGPPRPADPSPPSAMCTVRDVLRAEGFPLDDVTAKAASQRGRQRVHGKCSDEEDDGDEGDGGTDTGERDQRKRQEDSIMADRRRHGTWDEFVEGTVPRLVMDVFRRPGRVLRDVATLSRLDLSVTAITAHRNGFLFVGSADGTVSLWTPYAGARVESISAITALPAAIHAIGESVKRQFLRVREAIVAQRRRAAYETDATLGRNDQEGQERIKAQVKSMLLQHQVNEKRSREMAERERALLLLHTQQEEEHQQTGTLQLSDSPSSMKPNADTPLHSGVSPLLLRELRDKRDILLFTLGVDGVREMAAKNLHLEDLCFLPLRMQELAEVDAFSSSAASAAAAAAAAPLAYSVAVDVAVRRLFRHVCGFELGEYLRPPAPRKSPGAGPLPATTDTAVGGEASGDLSPAALPEDARLYAVQHRLNANLLEETLTSPSTTSEAEILQLCHMYSMSEAALEERWELAQAAEVARELAAAAVATNDDKRQEQQHQERRWQETEADDLNKSVRWMASSSSFPSSPSSPRAALAASRASTARRRSSCVPRRMQLAGRGMRLSVVSSSSSMASTSLHTARQVSAVMPIGADPRLVAPPSPLHDHHAAATTAAVVSGSEVANGGASTSPAPLPPHGPPPPPLPPVSPHSSNTATAAMATTTATNTLLPAVSRSSGVVVAPHTLASAAAAAKPLLRRPSPTEQSREGNAQPGFSASSAPSFVRVEQEEGWRRVSPRPPLPTYSGGNSGVAFDGSLARWELRAKPTAMRAKLTGTGRISSLTCTTLYPTERAATASRPASATAAAAIMAAAAAGGAPAVTEPSRFPFPPSSRSQRPSAPPKGTAGSNTPLLSTPGTSKGKRR